MTNATPDRIRQDTKLLRITLWRLSTPWWVRRGIVIGVVFVVWLVLARRILAFGASVSVAGVGASEPLTGVLTTANEYIWWVLVGILAIIAIQATRAWVRSSLASERATPVPVETLSQLAAQLSADVMGVLRWVWDDHDAPYTIGHLQNALAETRGGRIDKTELARDQQQVLFAEPAVAVTPVAPVVTAPVVASRGTAAATAVSSPLPEPEHAPITATRDADVVPPAGAPLRD
jgi:hypothetical protein